MSEFLLNLRGVVCPLNFVRTKLFLDKISAGERVTVLLDDGEPVESVTASVIAEGHNIVGSTQAEDGHHAVTIRKRS